MTSVAVPVDGQPFAAEFASIDGDWTIAFQADSGPRQLEAADLVRWGNAPELNTGPLIVLAGGGALAAEVRSIEGEQVIADSLLFGEVRLTFSQVRGIVFDPPAERLQRDQLLDRVRGATGSRDRLLLENGDTVEGVLAGESRRDVHGPPTAQEAQQLESVRMQVEDGAVNIPVERIVAAIFNPSLVGSPPASGLRVWLGFEDDGLLLVERVQSFNGAVKFTLPGGVLLQTSEDGLQQSLQLIQPVGGKATYLSDLEPIGYRHLPYLTLEWGYGRDRNVLGGRLRSASRIFLKGLGMHSTSRLAYRLNGAARFEAKLALDDSAGREGSVVYRVYTAHASGQWEPAFESQAIRGGDPPTPISVDISGARGLALIVEHADRGDVQDHANWLDARLE